MIAVGNERHGRDRGGQPTPANIDFKRGAGRGQIGVDSQPGAGSTFSLLLKGGEWLLRRRWGRL